MLKALLTISGFLILTAVIGFILDVWYRVYIVGKYYQTGGYLDNVLVGGLPLWMLLASVVLYAMIKKGAE